MSKTKKTENTPSKSEISKRSSLNLTEKFLTVGNKKKAQPRPQSVMLGKPLEDYNDFEHSLQSSSSLSYSYPSNDDRLRSSSFSPRVREQQKAQQEKRTNNSQLKLEALDHSLSLDTKNYEHILSELQTCCDNTQKDLAAHYNITWKFIHGISYLFSKITGIKHTTPLTQFQTETSAKLKEELKQQKEHLESYMRDHPNTICPTLDYHFVYTQLEEMSKRFDDSNLLNMPRNIEELERFKEKAEYLILSAYALNDGLRSLYQHAAREEDVQYYNDKIDERERLLPKDVVDPFVEAYQKKVYEIITKSNKSISQEDKSAILQNAEKVAFIYCDRLKKLPRSEIIAKAQIAAQRAVTDVTDSSINPDFEKFSKDQQVLLAIPEDPRIGWFNRVLGKEDDFFREDMRTNDMYGPLRRVQDIPKNDYQKGRAQFQEQMDDAMGVVSLAQDKLQEFLPMLKQSLYNLKYPDLILEADKITHHHQQHTLQMLRKVDSTLQKMESMDHSPMAHRTKQYDALIQSTKFVEMSKTIMNQADFIYHANQDFLRLPGELRERYNHTMANTFPLLHQYHTHMYSELEAFHELAELLKQYHSEEIELEKIHASKENLSENGNLFKEHFLKSYHEKWGTKPKFSEADLERIATTLASYYGPKLDNIHPDSIQSMAKECSKRAVYVKEKPRIPTKSTEDKDLWCNQPDLADRVLAYVRFNNTAASSLSINERNRPLKGKDGKPIPNKTTFDFLEGNTFNSRDLPHPKDLFINDLPDKLQKLEKDIHTKVTELRKIHMPKMLEFEKFRSTITQTLELVRDNKVPEDMNQPRTDDQKPIGENKTQTHTRSPSDGKENILNQTIDPPTTTPQALTSSEVGRLP